MVIWDIGCTHLWVAEGRFSELVDLARKSADSPHHRPIIVPSIIERLDRERYE